MHESIIQLRAEFYAYLREPNEARLSQFERSMVAHLVNTRSVHCLEILVQVATSPSDFAFAAGDGELVQPDGELLRQTGHRLLDAADTLDPQGVSA